MYVSVKKEVDVKYEISAVVQKIGGGIIDHGKHQTPALLFERVRGYDIPVLTNVFPTRRNIALALQVHEDDIIKKYIDAENNPLEPRVISTGPVKEVIQKGEEVDLTCLPILTHCSKDIGAFITGAILITKDPETNYVNAGMYRHMLKGKRKLGGGMAPQSHAGQIFKKKEGMGDDQECALILGHHPALYIAASHADAYGVSELSLAGSLFGQPLEMIRCETIDLEVPAYAEIVIEGLIKANMREEDAPFGEYLGYYGTEISKKPIIEVTAITRRKDAIFHDIYNAGIEHPLLSTIGKEAVLFKRVKSSVPQVSAVRMPMSGKSHLVYVQLKKGYEGSGKNAALAALTTPHTKIAVTVDDDIDINDDSNVMWAIVTRTDPDRSFFFIPESFVSRLDPMSYTLKSRGEKGTLSTKLGIDATKPLMGAFPEVALPPREVLDRIDIAEYLGLETTKSTHE